MGAVRVLPVVPTVNLPLAQFEDNGTNSYQETLNEFWHANVIALTIVTNGRLMETSISYW